MQERCKFSVVTPSFNQGDFLARTLHSVLDQKTDFLVEHIVVDGGSTDNTPDILKQHAGTIRFVSEPDRGMADALNKGFSMSTGEIIGWLNSDDTYLPGALQKASDYFDQHPDCLWLYGNCRIINDQDREIRKWITAYKNRKSRNFKFERLLLKNFISQPAVFIRRNALMRVGPIDLDLPTAMDYDLWLRLAKLGTPGYINDDLACFRVHQDSISSINYKAQFEEQYRIHQKYDRNRRLLFIHRINIRMIVFIYSLNNLVQKIFT
jgi:glycosyltransferase involved in cell wall biosynthesis